MTKKQARDIFGKRFLRLCEMMGYCPSAVSAWPDELDERRTNEVVGCAIRNGLKVPDEFMRK